MTPTEAVISCVVASLGIVASFVFAFIDTRPTTRPSIREQAWYAEMESTRAFATAQRRMMQAAFNYQWNKRYGGRS